MIHHIQIDNQMPAAIFPTILAPIPPPKSVSAESGMFKSDFVSPLFLGGGAWGVVKSKLGFKYQNWVST